MIHLQNAVNVNSFTMENAKGNLRSHHDQRAKRSHADVREFAPSSCVKKQSRGSRHRLFHQTKSNVSPLSFIIFLYLFVPTMRSSFKTSHLEKILLTLAWVEPSVPSDMLRAR